MGSSLFLPFSSKEMEEKNHHLSSDMKFKGRPEERIIEWFFTWPLSSFWKLSIKWRIMRQFSNFLETFLGGLFFKKNWILTPKPVCSLRSREFERKEMLEFLAWWSIFEWWLRRCSCSNTWIMMHQKIFFKTSKL